MRQDTEAQVKSHLKQIEISAEDIAGNMHHMQKQDLLYLNSAEDFEGKFAYTRMLYNDIVKHYQEILSLLKQEEGESE